MKKLFMMLLMGMFMLSLASAEICYQESATVENQTGIDGPSSDCGLTYNGAYGGTVSPAAFYDGDFATWVAVSYGGGTFNINYSKPTEYINSVDWKVRDSGGYKYATLAPACVAQDYVQIRAVFGGGRFECYNGAAWETVVGASFGAFSIYEEAITWNVTPGIIINNFEGYPTSEELALFGGNVVRTLSIDPDVTVDTGFIDITPIDSYLWAVNSTINSGIPDVGGRSAPAVFYRDGAWRLIVGETDGVFNGFTWSGSTWASDSAVVAGTYDIGYGSTPAVWEMGGTWYMLAGEANNKVVGFNWTGSAWQADTNIQSGVGGLAIHVSPGVFFKDGEWYLIAAAYNSIDKGYKWNGTTWEDNSAITDGLTYNSYMGSPQYLEIGGEEYLIVGHGSGGYYGFKWNGTGWDSYSNIINSLPYVTNYAKPAVWTMDGEVYALIGGTAGNCNGEVLTTVGPSSSYFEVSGVSAWDYPTELTATETADFASELNTALNGGACDCSGCEIINDTCLVNFTFYSGGIIEYSGMDVSLLTVDISNDTTTLSPADATTYWEENASLTLESSADTSSWFSWFVDGVEKLAGWGESVFSWVFSLPEESPNATVTLDVYKTPGTINTFTTSLTTEALTFSGDSNITRTLSIPETSILTAGQINLSGASARNWVEQEFADTTDYGATVTWDNSYNWVKAYDGNWGTFGKARTGYTANLISYYNKPVGALDTSTWTWRSGTIGYRSGVFPANCWSQPQIQVKMSSFSGDSNLQCWNGASYTTLSSNSYSGYIYEENIDWDMGDSYLTNPWLEVNGTQVWSHSGTYTGADITSDFLSEMESYVNATEPVAGVYEIPFVFHSDTTGALTYSNLNISTIDLTASNNFTIVTNSEAPNVQIIYPVNGSTYIQEAPITDLNYTFSDATASDCWYNLDDGTNHSIVCGTNVSNMSIENGGIHTISLYANDSMGNLRTETTTFTYQPLAHDPSNVIYRCGIISISGNYTMNETVSGTDCLTSAAEDVNLIIVAEDSNVTFFLNSTDVLTGNFSFGDNIQITNESVYINSTALASLDRPASITLNKGATTYSLPVITRDSLVCTDCVSSTGDLNSQVVEFTVTGFSNYTIGDEPSIELVSPANLSVYNESWNNISINFNVTDSNLDSCWYNDGRDTYSTTCNTNVSYLVQDGENIITYYANDTDGNPNNNTLYVYGGAFVVNISNATTGEVVINGTTYWEEDVNLTFNSSTPSTSWFDWLVGGVSKLAGIGENVFNWVFSLPSDSPNETVTLETYFVEDRDIKTFNSSLTSENITFTGDENHTRWLSIPEDTPIIEGTLDITGYQSGATTEEIYQEDPDSFSFDANIFYVNYTKPADLISMKWLIKAGGYPGPSVTTVNYTVPQLCIDQPEIQFRVSHAYGSLNQYYSCWTGTAWSDFYKNGPPPMTCGGGDERYKLYDGNWATSQHYGSGGLFNCDSVNGFYEEAVWFTVPLLPENPSVFINDTEIWNYTGSFGTTETTSDFESALNDYISATSPVGGEYLIPFVFHSDGVGILEYSNFDITQLDNLSSENFTIETNSVDPVVVISAPVDDGDYEGDVVMNWTAVDDTLEECWYNFNGVNITVESIPLGHWDMNDNLPTTNVINSIGEYNGTLDGSNTEDISVTGKVGTALHFNGNSNAISLQDGGAFNFLTEDSFSVSFWINPDTWTSSDRLFSNRDVGDAGWNIIAQTSGGAGNYIQFWGIGAGGILVSTDEVTIGAWNHVVVTFDNGIGNIYIDNGAPSTGAATIATTSYNLIIGKDPIGVATYDGAIDEVKIYDSALSASEVSVLYTAAASALSGNCSEGSLPITMSQGVYDLTLWANDSVGNEGLFTVSNISVGYGVPQIEITYPVDGASYVQADSIANLSYVFNDESPSNCKYNIDGGVNNTVNCTSGVAYPVINTSGTYTINLYAEDSYGNTNMSTVTFDHTHLAYSPSNVIYQCGEIIASGDYIVNDSVISGVNCINSSANDVNLIFQGEDSNVTFFLTDSDVLSGDFTTGVYINIANEYAHIDSANLPALDRAANITLSKGATSYLLQSIMRDRTPCTDCIQYTSDLNDAVVTFAVTGFSNYTIGDEPSVELISPANLTAYNESWNDINMNFNVTDTNLDSCWYNNNDGENVSATCNVDSSYLVKDGLNVITYYANDTDGNSNSTTLYLYGGPFVTNITDDVTHVVQINGTSEWEENASLEFNSSSPSTSWFEWLVGGALKLAGWGENVFNWVFSLPVDSANETVTVGTYSADGTDRDTFSNSLTSENITFSGNEDQVRTLIVPRDSTVTYADIELSGFHGGAREIEDATSYVPDYSLGSWTDSGLAISDNDWDTASRIQAGTQARMHFNYTKPDWATQAGTFLEVKDSWSRRNSTFTGDLGAGYNSSACWDEQPMQFRATSTNTAITWWYCYGGGTWQVFSGNVVTPQQGYYVYEESMHWGNSPPNNVSLTVDGVEVWDYSGDFNTTGEQTTNFASTLGTALNAGACDCDGCTINGDNCEIDFTFHSDTSGIVEYSEFNLTFSNLTTSEEFLIVTNSTIPSVTATAPTGVQPHLIYEDGLEMTLEYSITDENPDTCWYEYNSINTTISCGGSETNFTYVPINNEVTVYANDTLGNMNSDSTNWSFVLAETGQTYNANTFETRSEDFDINFIYDSSLYFPTATLYYNGDDYTGTTSDTGDTLEFTATLDIPATPNATNYTFYWVIELEDLANSSDVTTFISNTHTQSIGAVSFSVCNYSEGPQLYFSTYDASNQSSMPATFASSWTISDSTGGDVLLSRAYEDLTETNSSWGFCIEPNDADYTISVDLTVDGTTHTPTSHYIVETDYSNETQNVSLYLLADADSTLTQLKVVNQDSQVQGDVYITIQRYDQGTGTYYNVGMVKTAADGTDLAYLKWYDEWYKFIGVKDGSVIFTEGPVKISASPKTFTYGATSGSEYEKYKNVLYSLTYNNDTDNVVLTFVDPAGTVSSNCLRVIKRNQTKDYLICETCESSSSATVYCNIAAYGNGTYIANYYAFGSPRYYIASLYIYDGTNETLYDLIGNDNGTGLAILFAGIVMALFLITPALGIVGMLIGIIGAVALGFQPFDTMAFMGLVAAGLAILWAVQK